MIIPVLGGFVRLVEDWGHGDAEQAEAGIIEAARQSTQGSFRGWEQDSKLLKFLYEHQHSTPFEFAGMVIEVKAPIMVFREWQRHRTQSYNEMSARYAPLPNDNYVPTVDRCVVGAATSNKQAQGMGVELNGEDAMVWLNSLKALYDYSQDVYKRGLAYGVPKELARLAVTVGRYSQMRAAANLRCWLAFMTLRCDPAAQFEIRLYAGAVANIIAARFPQTFGLWAEQFMQDTGVSI